jgi:hypothetical protein
VVIAVLVARRTSVAGAFQGWQKNPSRRAGAFADGFNNS